MLIFWIVGLALTGILLILGLMLWIRKVRFDSIQANFWDLKDEFKGQIIRRGFASRPQFAGEINGDHVAISITSESGKDNRKYYIAVTMDAAPKTNIAVKSLAWMNNKYDENGKDNFRKINQGQYILETTSAEYLDRLNIAGIEAAVKKIDPFAYVLIGNSSLLIERVSGNLLEDTSPAEMRALINGAHALKRIVE